MSETKTRNFAFILYPESLPNDWKAQLEAIGVPMAISPLHDKDKSERKSEEAMRKDAERRAKKQLESMPDSLDKAVALKQAKDYWLSVVHHEQDNLPEHKKPHYHVLYVNHNPVTAKSVLNKLRRKLGDNAVNHVEIVDNVANYFLYLTHESPDAKAHNKYVYDKKDIVTLNNFDIDRYVILDREQKNDMLLAVKRVICDNLIPNIIDLEFFLQEHGKEHGLGDDIQVMSVIRDNVGYVRLYLDGAYQKLVSQGGVIPCSGKSKAVKSQTAIDVRPPKSDKSETP